MTPVYDVYTHPSGASFEASVADAVPRFRARHGCEPVAVWANPSVESAEEAVAGLPLIRSRHMNSWYVYLEVPAAPQLPLFLAADEVDESAAAESPAPVQMTLFRG
jgi:hypothetical protein